MGIWRVSYVTRDDMGGSQEVKASSKDEAIRLVRKSLGWYLYRITDVHFIMPVDEDKGDK